MSRQTSGLERKAKRRLRHRLLKVQPHCPYCQAELTKTTAVFDSRTTTHSLCCEQCNSRPNEFPQKPEIR